VKGEERDGKGERRRGREGVEERKVRTPLR